MNNKSEQDDNTDNNVDNVENAQSTAIVENAAEATAETTAKTTANKYAEKPLEQKPALNSQPVDKTAKNTAGNKSSSVITFVTLFLAIAAVAMSAYLWQLNDQRQQQLQSINAGNSAVEQRLDQQLAANRNMQREFDRQQAKQQQQQLTTQNKIELLQQQLASQNKKLLSLSTTDRDDWLLAEAEYLMRLANQRLLMGKEIQGAQDLLMAADDIAKELDDTALYLVRKALAGDIAALQTVARFDLEGIYLQLDALAKEAGKLRLIKLPQLTTKPEEQMPELEPTWQQRLQQGFNAAGEKLSQYVQINRRDEIYKPLLAPEYEAAVRQNVRLMIEQAQMASLAGKQKIYQDSLLKAKTWLSNYYTLDQQATHVIVRAIDELSQQQIAVQLPDISASLRALKNYMETIHSIKPSKKENANRQSNENTQSNDKGGTEESGE
jgi:uroporphyrin-3 C-methyltransferase